MKRFLQKAVASWVLIVSVFLLMQASLLFAQEQIDWKKGPANVDIGAYAKIDIPEGFIFTGKEGAQKALKLMGNLLTNREVGLIAPADFISPQPSEKDGWFVVFEFAPIGYVKDDEKNSIDKNALLESFQKGAKQANIERTKQGFPTFEIVGWSVEPHYDEATHNLEWGMEYNVKQGEMDRGNTVNYEVRLLGREGVMSSMLVLSPNALQATLPEFRKLLKTYEFKPGKRYTEFVSGDKVAQYGLTALITGGAVAVAAKSGLLKHLWKIIVAVSVGAAALLKKLFGKKEKETVINQG